MGALPQLNFKQSISCCVMAWCVRRSWTFLEVLATNKPPLGSTSKKPD